MMCSYGCFAVQTNDQGREIVNEVSDELQLLADVKQWVTRAYRLQSSDLVERQNRTIKNSFVKVLEENPLKWSSIIEGVLLIIASVNTPLQNITLSIYYAIEKRYYQ